MTTANLTLPEELTAQIEELTTIEALHLTSIIAMFLSELADGGDCTQLTDFEEGAFPLTTTSDVQAILSGLDELAANSSAPEAESALIATMQWQAQVSGTNYLSGIR